MAAIGQEEKNAPNLAKIHGDVLIEYLSFLSGDLEVLYRVKYFLIKR